MKQSYDNSLIHLPDKKSDIRRLHFWVLNEKISFSAMSTFQGSIVSTFTRVVLVGKYQRKIRVYRRDSSFQNPHTKKVNFGVIIKFTLALLTNQV